MKARASFCSSTDDQAHAAATKAFDKFFGDHRWTFTSEEAVAGATLASGTVLDWTVTFEAESV